MPSRPARLCQRCRAIRHGDKCEACGSVSYRWTDKRRGNKNERGYDNAWGKLRARKLIHDPLCAVCLAAGRTTAADQVHHVRPFNGVKDPLRLAWGNLMSLCRPCHAVETAGRH